MKIISECNGCYGTKIELQVPVDFSLVGWNRGHREDILGIKEKKKKN